MTLDQIVILLCGLAVGVNLTLVLQTVEQRRDERRAAKAKATADTKVATPAGIIRFPPGMTISREQADAVRAVFSKGLCTECGLDADGETICYGCMRTEQVRP